ncbi:MAG: haloacid dehalogenase [Dehalococcoidia bacterium]
MSTIKKSSNKLDKIANRIRSRLAEKDAAREICLKSCREIIRFSSTSIRATHRGDKETALKLVNSASSLVDQLQTDFKRKHHDLLSANYVHDSFKEYAEASITYSIIFNGEIPDPDELAVAYPAYLNGLAESVGELRRYVLDGLRTDKFDAAEDLLAIMDHIYSVLVTMDFPDAITYGLRRNTDSVRGIVEKTRGDLTLVIHNNLLQEKISVLSSKLSNSTDQT